MVRKGLIAVILLFGIASTIVAAHASPASGLWRMEEDDALVEIYDCGGRLCGRVMTSNEIAAHPDLKDFNNGNPPLRNLPVKGINVVSGFSGGPKSWSNGVLYRPQDGRSYSGSLELIDGARLQGTGGCMGYLCKTTNVVESEVAGGT
jgi:uncharacterized protein (DUF2147 family)